jgi:hypothetical protein
MRWQHIAAASAGHSAVSAAAAAEVAGNTEDADDDSGDQDEPRMIMTYSQSSQPAGSQRERSHRAWRLHL